VGRVPLCGGMDPGETDRVLSCSCSCSCNNRIQLGHATTIRNSLTPVCAHNQPLIQVSCCIGQRSKGIYRSRKGYAGGRIPQKKRGIPRRIHENTADAIVIACHTRDHFPPRHPNALQNHISFQINRHFPYTRAGGHCEWILPIAGRGLKGFQIFLRPAAPAPAPGGRAVFLASSPFL
jgi:hypothetical protein